MNNQTISMGIDLGTTNSSVCINIDGKIEIIKKPGGVEFTPSVFGFNKSSNKIVGQKAYDFLYKHNSEEENKNFVAEIKRQMGTPNKISFARPNIKMTPEEISAEILKNLKEEVLRKYPDFNDVAAVITIPAAFSVLQSEATKRAGNLAGFKQVVLLQEPIAAAISYGFDNSKNENWMIFDFGGGTFDVALISCKEGILSVVAHSGNNFLGGKNIDWEIVDKIIIPKIKEKYTMKKFNRKNALYMSVFSKLKYYAESAKIDLSEYKKTTIEIDDLGKDDEGKDIFISIPFSRNDLEKLMKSKIDNTINLTKDMLKESGIKASLIKKIILVGGPTQMPYIKRRLEEDIKIKVDSSVDPLTIVSRGACIFGLSQKIQKKLLKQKQSKDHQIELNCETLTSDIEESVTGTISGLNSNEQYYIQIQSESGTFLGEKTKINKGKFFYSVNIEPNKQNKFAIFLFDSNGKSIKLATDHFVITHGLSVSGAPIPHSISIVVASHDYVKNKISNICETIFKKGSILPLKKILDVYKTSRKLNKGEDASLDIVVVEGESTIPDRNTFLCNVGIKGKEIPHDLPINTPVELTIDHNESRELIVTAYIPLLDLTTNARVTTRDQKINSQELTEDFVVQKKRAESISEKISIEEKSKMNEKMVSISNSINNSSVDEDEKRKANKELKDIKILLDNIEKEKAIPQLKQDYETLKQQLQEIISEYVEDDKKVEYANILYNIKKEYKQAITEKNKTHLIRLMEQLEETIISAMFSNPAIWVDKFRSLTQIKTYTNEKEAEYYINKGFVALDKKDIEELKRIVIELEELLPEDEAEKVRISGIKR
jgi:molecular chaperone DnaK